MIKYFEYQGVKYKTERDARQAIYKAERKAIPVCKTAAEWLRFSVVYTEVEDQQTQEQLEHRVRYQRDRLLAACDYYVMQDYPSTEEGLIEVKHYRQALRDITEQDGFPSDVVWPKTPKVLA